MERNRIIQLIHIAKANTLECSFCGRLTMEGSCPECNEYTVPLSKGRYRQLLQDLTGKDSTKFMSEEDLEKVYALFTQAGFLPGKKLDEVEKDYRDGRRKTIGITIRLARQTLGKDWEERLEGFVFSKSGKKKLYELDDNQLRQVIGWLRRKRKYRTAEDSKGLAVVPFKERKEHGKSNN